MWLLLSGELPSAEAEYWQNYFAAHPEWQAELVEARATVQGYERLPEAEAPEYLIARVTNYADAALTKTQSETWWSRLKNQWAYSRTVYRVLFTGPRLALAGAAVVLIATVLLHGLRTPKPALSWKEEALDLHVLRVDSLLNSHHQQWGISADEIAGGENSVFDEKLTALRDDLAYLRYSIDSSSF